MSDDLKKEVQEAPLLWPLTPIPTYEEVYDPKICPEAQREISTIMEGWLHPKHEMAKPEALGKVRVLECGHGGFQVTAMQTGGYLGELGANVIMVEPPCPFACSLPFPRRAYASSFTDWPWASFTRGMVWLTGLTSLSSETRSPEYTGRHLVFALLVEDEEDPALVATQGVPAVAVLRQVVPLQVCLDRYHPQPMGEEFIVEHGRVLQYDHVVNRHRGHLGDAEAPHGVGIRPINPFKTEA